jgi:predicted nucleic-acid-binding protein
LDTNLLVRLITDDDPAQADAVENLMETRCFADDPGFVNRAVLCEVVWVLARRFRYDRAEIANVVLGLYRTPALLLEDAELIPEALRLYRTSRTDFADILIGLTNRMADCTVTFTFDRRAAQVEGFQALQPSG